MSKQYNTIRFENAVFNASDDGLNILDYGDANMFRANIFKIQKICEEKMGIYPLSTEVVAVWGHWYSKDKGWTSIKSESTVVKVFKDFIDNFSPSEPEKKIMTPKPKIIL